MSDDKFERMESKLDRIVDKIGSIDITLHGQHVSLTDHIRRTELLEEQLRPVEKHVAMVQGALKLIGLIALVGGILGGAAEFLMFVKDLK